MQLDTLYICNYNQHVGTMHVKTRASGSVPEPRHGACQLVQEKCECVDTLSSSMYNLCVTAQVRPSYQKTLI